MDFEEIYRRYFNDVFLYIRGLSGDESLAEEITSDTFFKALKNIDRFRGECDIRVWLCQIAKNSYFSHLKKTRRQVSLEEEDLSGLPDPGETPEEACLRRDNAARLKQLLHTVPEPYKEVFMWRVFAELSFREIDRLFQKSENWACVTYYRARAMIKEKWEESENE